MISDHFHHIIVYRGSILWAAPDPVGEIVVKHTILF